MADTIAASFGLDITPLRRSAAAAQGVGERLGANFTRSLSGIGTAVTGLSGALGGLGVAIGGTAIIGAIQSIVSYADDIGDMAEQVNMNTTAYQRNSFAVTQAGGSARGFHKGLVALNGEMINAINGNEKSTATFKALGISLGELKTLSPDAVLLRMADAIKAGGANGAATAAAVDILGKKVASELLPSLKNGSAAFTALGASATIASEEALKAAGEIDNKWNELATNIRAQALNIAVSTAEVFKKITDTGSKSPPNLFDLGGLPGTGSASGAGDANKPIVPDFSMNPAFGDRAANEEAFAKRAGSMREQMIGNARRPSSPVNFNQPDFEGLREKAITNARNATPAELASMAADTREIADFIRTLRGPG